MKWSDVLERLIALRVERGLNQVQLAERLGWAKQTLNNIEAGRRWSENKLDLEALSKWAAELDHTLVFELVPKGWQVTVTPTPLDDLWAALSEEDREHLARLARVLPQLPRASRAAMMNEVREWEADLFGDRAPHHVNGEAPEHDVRARQRG